MIPCAPQGLVQACTASINRIQGLLAEVGIVSPLKTSTVRRRALELQENFPCHGKRFIGDLVGEVHDLNKRIKAHDRHISPIANQTMRFCGEGTTDARSHEESSG
jgi:hypothetical protein